MEVIGIPKNYPEYEWPSSTDAEKAARESRHAPAAARNRRSLLQWTLLFQARAKAPTPRAKEGWMLSASSAEANEMSSA